MDVEPQAAYRAIASYLAGLASTGDSRIVHEERDGAVLAISGISAPFANGAWVIEPDADSDVVREFVHRARATGLPFLFVGRADRRDEWAEIADQAGLAFAEDTPLMVLDDLSHLPPAPPTLHIHREGPDAHDEHIRLTSDAFDVPQEVFIDLMTMTGHLPSLRVYVGEVDGRVVATALSMATAEDSVGIFNVATPAAERGHGYGAAITAHAIEQAAREGARWAWLQSSEAGFSVYERLGFSTVGMQPMWVHLGA